MLERSPMPRTIKLVALALALTQALARAGTPKTESVSYKSGDDIVTAFLAIPETPGRHPALVVIHEWWGLNDWVKDQAQKLAHQGYVALAVDLYRGKSAGSRDEAHELMRGMPQDRAVRDLRAGFEYLASRPDVEKDKIGSIGWIMGGGLSLQLAVHTPRLAACDVHCGAMPTDPADNGLFKVPVLRIFGSEALGINRDALP